MCIRDSFLTLEVVGDLVDPVDEDEGSDLAELALEGVDAVSYTHLRAHETVLDLVCRLLLEKKTNTDISLHNNTSLKLKHMA